MGEQGIIGLQTVSVVMWAAVVYSDPAYHRSLRKLSLTVRVKSHTHPCMCLPMLLSLKRIYLRCPLYLSLASFHTCFIAFLLSFSPSLPLPATFNSPFYFCLFLSSPSRIFFSSFSSVHPLDVSSLFVAGLYMLSSFMSSDTPAASFCFSTWKSVE